MEEGEELAREHVGAVQGDLARALEPVVRKHGRDRDADADRGRDERLAEREDDLAVAAAGLRGGGGRGGGGLLRLAEHVERLDDADDGAEEADERRVRAERSEEAQPALELRALGNRLCGHRLVRLFRRRLVFVAAHAAERDGGGGVAGGLHRRTRGGEAALAERLRERLAEGVDVVPSNPEHVPALEHDRDREHAEPDEQPEDPGGARADHDVLRVLDQVHSLSSSSGASAGASSRAPSPRTGGAGRVPSRTSQATARTEVAYAPFGSTN